MKKFGLIGFPLTHSFSKQFFNKKFTEEKLIDYSYELFPINKIEALKEILEKENGLLKGLNVTIPYKIAVLPFLNDISEEAQHIGAVNCIKIDEKNTLKGYNTDVYGFRESLKPLLKSHHKCALILGNGGATKAVIYALMQLNIDYTIVSRNPQNNYISYDEVDENILKSHQIIINTTPLGMMPKENSAPEIPYQYINTQHLAFDLVYNPEKTLFLNKCETRGALCKNGLEMLHLQALAAWNIWHQ